MANGNCVTRLMKANDVNVKLSVFDDTNFDITSPTAVNDWLNFIKLGLGNCIFKEGIYIIKIYTDSESSDSIGVMNTKEVYSILEACFDYPETFRIDIITPNTTVFSWIFALASDLNKKK